MLDHVESRAEAINGKNHLHQSQLPDPYSTQQSHLAITFYSPSIPADVDSFESITLKALKSVNLSDHQVTFNITRSSDSFHGAINGKEVVASLIIWPHYRQASINFLSHNDSDTTRRLADAFVQQLRPMTSEFRYCTAASQNLSVSDTVKTAPPGPDNELLNTRNLSKTPAKPGDTELDWVYEYDNAGEQHHYQVNRLLEADQTDYQHYAILETVAYGKVLFLDGYIQSAQKDEHIYHECLVQPAMLAHPDPRNVLIIGAGEGAAAREVLYHPSVEKLVLVDLDEKLINACNRHLDTHHRGAFGHEKVELRFEDGYEYIRNCDQRFDVIIIDVVDAIEEGPAQALYKHDFYTYLLDNTLTENGIVVVQSMELNDVNLNDDWYVHREMAQSFRHVCSYSTFVPSFWSKWRFTVASNRINLASLSDRAIDQEIQIRGIDAHLNYFSGEIFPALCALSKQARTTLDKALNETVNKHQVASITNHIKDWELSSFLRSTRGKKI